MLLLQHNINLCTHEIHKYATVHSMVPCNFPAHGCLFCLLVFSISSLPLTLPSTMHILNSPCSCLTCSWLPVTGSCFCRVVNTSWHHLKIIKAARYISMIELQLSFWQHYTITKPPFPKKLQLDFLQSVSLHIWVTQSVLIHTTLTCLFLPTSGKSRFYLNPLIVA